MISFDWSVQSKHLTKAPKGKPYTLVIMLEHGVKVQIPVANHAEAVGLVSKQVVSYAPSLTPVPRRNRMGLPHCSKCIFFSVNC